MIGKCSIRWEEAKADGEFFWVHIAYRIVPGPREQCPGSICKKESRDLFYVEIVEVHEIIDPDGLFVEVESKRGGHVIVRLKQELEKKYCLECLPKYYIGI
jgi:hypothetical protein